MGIPELTILLENPTVPLTPTQLQALTTLVTTALFAEQLDKRTHARNAIYEIAKKRGAVLSSLYTLYKKIGNQQIPHTFTVPAFNIRGLTHDISYLIFCLMNKHSIGPVIFEIARSEIDYTQQSPEEYAIAVLSGALRANYRGPVFLQGDHYQLSKKQYVANPTNEIKNIETLITASINAGFYNIDIDASTLVDLSMPTIQQQQEINYELTAKFTQYIRRLVPKEITVAIGGELGHIGGKDSTVEEFKIFMDNYLHRIKTDAPLSKISIQTGSSHGGTPLASGKIAPVAINFSLLQEISTCAKKEYKLAGPTQHGASTLPSDMFHLFPHNHTVEIHLATGFQNIIYDNMPSSLQTEIYAWLRKTCHAEREKEWSDEQFFYKTRKKAFGPFKKALWNLSAQEKKPILMALEKQFLFLFTQLNIFKTKDLLANYE